MDRYRNLTSCLGCTLNPRCTPTETRRVKRWVHEGVLDAMQDAPRSDAGRDEDPSPDRGAPVRDIEGLDGRHSLPHPDPRRRSRTEMSLQVLAYNMKRMIQDLRGRSADGGDQGLRPVDSPSRPPSTSCKSPRTTARSAFSHGLGQLRTKPHVRLPSCDQLARACTFHSTVVPNGACVSTVEDEGEHEHGCAERDGLPDRDQRTAD